MTLAALILTQFLRTGAEVRLVRKKSPTRPTADAGIGVGTRGGGSPNTQAAGWSEPTPTGAAAAVAAAFSASRRSSVDNSPVLRNQTPHSLAQHLRVQGANSEQAAVGAELEEGQLGQRQGQGQQELEGEGKAEAYAEADTKTEGQEQGEEEGEEVPALFVGVHGYRPHVASPLRIVREVRSRQHGWNIFSALMPFCAMW